MIAATAMIGTACFGPKAKASTGSSMIEAPVPMTPLTSPAASPTARTRAYGFHAAEPAVG